ncbi:MAG: phosphomethylpyrimidine synthase ThiC, partial [Lentisphaeria bacterium]
MEFKTQIEFAKAGIVTQEMKIVAKSEYLDEKFICEQVASGRIVIPANRNHKNLIPIGIGRALRCKINA